MSLVLKQPNGTSVLNLLGGGNEIQATHGSYVVPTILVNRRYDSGLPVSSALDAYFHRPNVKTANKSQHVKFLGGRWPFTIGHDLISDKLYIHTGRMEDENGLQGWFLKNLTSNDAGRPTNFRMCPLSASVNDYYSLIPTETPYSGGLAGGVLNRPQGFSNIGLLSDIVAPKLRYLIDGQRVIAHAPNSGWPVTTTYGASPVSSSGTVEEKRAWFAANIGPLQNWADAVADSFMDDMGLDSSTVDVMWFNELFKTDTTGYLNAIGSLDGIKLHDILMGHTNFTMWFVSDSDFDKVFTTVPHTSRFSVVGISRFIGVKAVNIGSAIHPGGSTSRNNRDFIVFDPVKPVITVGGSTGKGTSKMYSYSNNVDSVVVEAAIGGSLQTQAWIDSNLSKLVSIHPNLPNVLGKVVSGVGIGRSSKIDSWNTYCLSKSACMPIGVAERNLVMTTDWSTTDGGIVLSGNTLDFTVSVQGEALAQRMSDLYLEYNDNKFDAAYNDIQVKSAQLNGRYVRTKVFPVRVNDPGSILTTKLASDHDKGKKSADPLFKDVVIDGSKTIKHLDDRRPGWVGGFSLVTTFAAEYERAMSQAATTLLESPGSVTLRVSRSSQELSFSVGEIAGISEEDKQLLFLKSFPLGNGADELTYLSVAEAGALRSVMQVEYEVDTPRITKYGLQPYDLGATAYPPALAADVDTAKRQYFIFGTMMNDLTNQVILMTIQDKSLQVL